MHSRVSSPSSSHDTTSAPSPQPRARSKIVSASRIVLHHFKKHVGVGVICAVGYFDPGNWSVDIQAGASFGYRPMLFVIFVAGIIAIVLQAPIISTDLAELLGSAIGLSLLFPKLPLWSTVLLTGVDVFIFLIIGDPSRTGRRVRLFEVVIIVLTQPNAVY
ncbi:hypothetical protein M405DRAFT_726103, partial [Rhizopogon salebrosus TDB-379]